MVLGTRAAVQHAAGRHRRRTRHPRGLDLYGRVLHHRGQRRGYQSRQLDPLGKIDSYSLVNGRIGFESGDSWSLYLWGRNLLDEDYSFDWPSDFLGTSANFPGDPRTYGVEVTWRM